MKYQDIFYFYHCLANFHDQNPVISKGIHTIRNFT